MIGAEDGDGLVDVAKVPPGQARASQLIDDKNRADCKLSKSATCVISYVCFECRVLYTQVSTGPAWRALDPEVED